MDKEKIQMIVLGVLISACLLAGFYFLYFQGAVKEYAKLTKSVEELSGTAIAMRNITKKKMEINKEFDEAQSKLDEFYEYMPEEVLVSSYVHQIVGSGTVGVKTFSFERYEDNAMLDTLRNYYYSISMRVPAVDLCRFLARLEKDKPFLKVNDIIIRGDETAPYEHEVSLWITVIAKKD